MVVRQGSIVRARGERGRRRRRERDGSWARHSTRTRGLTTTRGRRRTVVGEGTIGDGTWESIRDDVETSVRDAVRRAHGVIDGGFEATVIGGDGGARGTMTFVVRVEHEYRRRLWSALTMATTFGERSCAYDVLGMEESLSALAETTR